MGLLDAASEMATAPRSRILAASRDLFSTRGLKGVSVDEIAAAARTNKMTLYRHFESKDLLIVEYLRALCAERDTVWAQIARSRPNDPVAQLKAWVAQVCEWIMEPDGRGCPISNAAVELPEKDHPGRLVIEVHKTKQRDRIHALCREAGFAEPRLLADEIFLLIEGARIDVQSVGLSGPGARLKTMVTALLKAHPRRTN